MSAKLYNVTLTSSQRQALKAMSRKGTISARQLTRARILLLADSGARDEQIVEATGASAATVQRIRRRYTTESLDAAIAEKPRPGVKPRLDARGEAQLTALACSDPPEGYARWTLRLLADKLVELKIVEGICPQSVANTLKKTTSSRGSSSTGA